MNSDLPCVLYIISMHIVNSNSRTYQGSKYWKLNIVEGKVVQVPNEVTAETESDVVMNIITNTLVENGQWIVQTNSKEKETNKQPTRCDNDSSEHPPSVAKPITTKKKRLTCGKSVNSTLYDHLQGIADRNEHGHIPEPEVAMAFKTHGFGTSEVDIDDLEKRLWKAKKEKPSSVQLFNDIGNFWRIKGNSQLSIECFRKALFHAPNNPEVLLNLARVLFNLQYLDDARSLTKQSLDMQSPEENSWLQHFTLGEILKARGLYNEASMHFTHTLKLKPGFEPAQAYLRELQDEAGPSVTQYTLLIILFLVLGVLFGVITSIEAKFEDRSQVIKAPRHFNRAMAMRSIKLGLNPRLMRMRKMNS